MKANIKKKVFSVQTRNNFLLDMSMLISGLIVSLSGIYFLFLPVGGYQGGRNPLYGLVILFERHTWGDIHIWSSVIITALLLLHIPIHWDWIIRMTNSGAKALIGKSNLNKYSQFNLGINVLIGLSGLICGLSGIYFLFFPDVLHGGTSSWLFSPVVWDLIHTWSGVVMISAAILHFGIHWKWVIKVTGKYWNALVNKFRESSQGIGNPIPDYLVEKQ